MQTEWTIGGKVYRLRAWTGGDSPGPEDKSGEAYRLVRRSLFREQLKECGGLDLWKCAGTSCMERARIFWNRASLDAWRTVSA